MKWALAFATARVLAEKIEFLEVPSFWKWCNIYKMKNTATAIPASTAIAISISFAFPSTIFTKA